MQLENNKLREESEAAKFELTNKVEFIFYLCLRSAFCVCVLFSVSLTCVFKNQYFFNKIYIFTNICVFYFI